MKIAKSLEQRTSIDLHRVKRATGIIILLYLVALSSAVMSSGGSVGALDGGSTIKETLDNTNTEFQKTITSDSNNTMTWLNEYPYRKSHDILQTPDTGIDYTVPIDVYLGSGTDIGNSVFLDQKARPGLDDVRFTDENNEPLDYWMENYYRSSAGKDYFIDDGAIMGWYYYCYPNSFYYNNRTYCAYQGEGFYVYMIYYDHENKTWSPSYYVGETQLTNDDHGAPAMWIDNDGYIHVIYGAHNNELRHAKSVYPERIDSFTMMPSVEAGLSTYPNVAYDAQENIVHLWYRRYPGGGICYLEYIYSLDNGWTWSTPHVLVSSTFGNTIYKCVGGLDNLDNKKIHFSWALYNNSDPYGQVYINVYYGFLDCNTGLVYNVTGQSQGSTVTQDEWSNMMALNTKGCHVTGPNMKVPSDSSNPYLVFNVQSSRGTGARTSTMVYWTGSEWSGMNNISTTTTNGASDIIIYSTSNISAFVTTGSDITHWTWDGSKWTFLGYCYKSSDSGGNYLSWAAVPVGAKWTGSNDPEIQVLFNEYITGGGKHTKAYAWGVNGIVQNHKIIGARFWVKCPGNLSEDNQRIYIYFGRSSEISLSKSFPISTDPSPTHGAWSPVESLSVLDTSVHSITRFSETAPDNMMLYPDSDTGGSGFSESFAVVSDWTSTGNIPITNGDVCTTTVPGDSAYDYLTSNSVHLAPGYYYVELRYRASVAGTSYFRLIGYDQENTEGSSTMIMDATYPATSWRTYRAGFYSSHGIESISISCIATSTTTDFQFDYLRISKETGWQHDGSTVFGITASGGGSVSTDGDYVMLTSDSDGSIFDFQVDPTSTVAAMSAVTYPFLSVKFHPGDANDVYSLLSFDGSGYGSLVNNKKAVDGRYYVRDVDTIVTSFRFIINPSQTVRIDFLKMYSIANFSITYLGGHPDAYLYVDSDGALVSSEDFMNGIELDYEPIMSMNTNQYQWAQIDQSNFSEFNLDLAYHVASLSPWSGELLYHLSAGVMSDFMLRLTNAGKIRSIKFGSLPLGSGNAPTNDYPPTISNLDDSSYLYAKTKDYQIAAHVSDPDGYENLAYMELTLVSADHVTEYWTIRYDVDHDVFSEQRDPENFVTLNTIDSTHIRTGNSSLITFFLTINWNHPDLSNVNFKCLVVDDQLYSDRDYYATSWSVETRLDMPSGLVLSDGNGTLNRGDINGEIQASGTLVYFGSTLHPSASEIDIFIVCSDVVTSPWSTASYDASSGAFSSSVRADDSVGVDTYTVRVVEKGNTATGANLLGSTQSANYIADAMDVQIVPNTAASTTTTVVFTLHVTYAYDDARASDYAVEVQKNGDPWQVITSDSFSDAIDPDHSNTYTIASVVENVHGITTLLSSSVFTLSENAANIWGNVSSYSPNTAVLEIFHFVRTIINGLIDPLVNSSVAIFDAANELYSLGLFFMLDSITGLTLGLLIAIGAVYVASLRRRKARKTTPKKKHTKEGPSSYEPKTLVSS